MAGGVLLIPTACIGGVPNTLLHLDLGPGSLKTEFQAASSGAAAGARVKTGIDLSLGRQALVLDLDYDLLGKPADNDLNGVLTQRVQTSVSSRLLDSILGVDVGLITDSRFHEGGEVYRHLVRPGISHEVPGLAQLEIQYEYAVDKASRLGPELTNSGYEVVVDGAFQDGRLSWRGSFSSRQRFSQHDARTGEVEMLGLFSRYQVAHSLHVELSGALRSETRYTDPHPQELSEARYGAAIGWSPSAEYVLGFKVDRFKQAAQARPNVLGSGSISWFPRPNLEFKLDYGDQLVEGQAGWLLQTRWDLNG
jgi:hypothetical protein